MGELPSHLALISFNVRTDSEGAAIIGVWSGYNAEAVPIASPLILFRIDERVSDPAARIERIKLQVAAVNGRVEQEAVRCGDPIAAMSDLAPPEILQARGRSSVPQAPTARPTT